MEDNTPVTQSFSGDNPIQDSPSKDRAGKDRVSTPARPKGANASAIVLGVVALAFAALIIAIETMDLAVDWSRLGPGAIVGIGLLLVVLGAIGLRRRHDDA
jgi:hypothetical protein